MKVDLLFDLPNGTTAVYEQEVFAIIPRIGETIFFEDEENDVELSGIADAIIWSNLSNIWEPSISIKVDNIAGEGRDKYLAKPSYK